MDIQLHVTDKEQEEFPEEWSDKIGITKDETGQLIQKAQPLTESSYSFNSFMEENH